MSAKHVFRLDPGTYKLTLLATYTGNIHCGFAIDGHGVYFGGRATLVRDNWPNTPAPQQT